MTQDVGIEVRPATLDRWSDVETLLGGDGDAGCWCQAWRGTDPARKALGLSRPEILRDQLATRHAASRASWRTSATTRSDGPA